MSTTPNSNSSGSNNNSNSNNNPVNKQQQQQDTYSDSSSIEENLDAVEERRRRILKNRTRSSTYMQRQQQHSNMSVSSGAISKHDKSMTPSTSSAAAIRLGPPERISMLVDGVRFTVEQTLLTAHPNTMLGTMFGTGFQFVHPNERGEYELADGISHLVFRAILEYYKSGVIRCPPTVSVPELKEACDYLLIPFDATTVRCQNLSEYVVAVADGRRVLVLCRLPPVFFCFSLTTRLC